MKRLVLCTLVLLCVVSLASIGNAQSKFALGGYVGPNFANLDVTDPDISTDSRTGLMIGGFVEYELAKMWYIEAGLAYVQGGGKFSLGQTATLKYDYLNIPVHVKAKFHLVGSEFTPLIYAGLNYGFNMNAEGEAGGETQDIKDNTESGNFALDFGVGAEYALNRSTSLIAFLGYSWGLTDILKGEGSIKTTGIPIGVGVRFSL